MLFENQIFYTPLKMCILKKLSFYPSYNRLFHNKYKSTIKTYYIQIEFAQRCSINYEKLTSIFQTFSTS